MKVTEIDTITTGELSGQQNPSTDPLPANPWINQQQSNPDVNDCESPPFILHQKEQLLKRNNQASTLDTIKKPKVHQKVNFLPLDENEWKVAEVISKAGKNKGKYEDWLNVHFEDETLHCTAQ